MERRCTVLSATLRGIQAIPVSVEVCLTVGIPGMSIVGMPDAAINESRERVKAAIRSCGFKFPADKIIVNLAPGYLRKTGSGFDLPIALGILVASGQLPSKVIENRLIVGELSLEGQVRPVMGMLPIQVCARDSVGSMLCAQPDEGLIALRNLEVLVAESLSQFHTGIFLPGREPRNQVASHLKDFASVGGQEAAKRALQIAACGMHGVLMVGPPGSGKTMLASCVPSIMPALTEEEMLETAQVYSIVGEDMTDLLHGMRPFRHPHHSITNPGLVGGGHPIRPGEISLAHNGVLFLDELGEFNSSTLQVLRQPMEQGQVTIVRADGNVMFPARFMLVAATNPCPCGFFGDPVKDCECTVPQIAHYRSKIGGPLLDRIDIQITVNRTEYDHIVNPRGGSSSAKLLEGVMTGRRFCSDRMQTDSSKQKEGNSLVERNHLVCASENLLRKASVHFDLSGRGITRTVSLARTIADMDESYEVLPRHVSEALAYRVRGEGEDIV